MLWSKFFRLNPMKLRDFRLLRDQRKSANARQEQLMKLYLENPEYERWLDGQTGRVWF